MAINKEDVINWGVLDSALKQIITNTNKSLSIKAVKQELAKDVDLNTVVMPGFYNVGGANTVVNKPNGVDYFGLIVVHNATGFYYTQTLYSAGNIYKRHCINNVWGDWTKDFTKEEKEQINKAIQLTQEETTESGQLKVYTTASTLDVRRDGQSSVIPVTKGSCNIREGNAKTYDLSGSEITKIKPLTTLSGVNKLLLYNNKITELDLSAYTGLQYIHIQDNPICDDADAFARMIQTLPDRNNKALGSIVTSNQTIRKEVEQIALQKNWVFGSTLQYDKTALAKMDKYITQSGVLDIWESAEYGENTTVALIDVGFSPNLKSVTKDRWLKYYNCSTQSGTDADPIPLPTDTNLPTIIKNHGNFNISTIGGSGTLWYGIAPKCSFIPIKMGSLDGSYNLVNITEALKSAVKDYNNIDVINYPATCAFASNQEQCNEIINLIDKFDAKNGKLGIPFFGSAGNAMDYSNIIQGIIDFKPCYSVSLIDYTNNHYKWSGEDYGCSINVAFSAYGKSIKAEQRPGALATQSGSSQSCSVMSGYTSLAINILRKQLNREPSLYEIIDWLNHRTKMPSNGNAKLSGNGYIDFMSYRTDYKENKWAIERGDYI